MLTPGLVLVAGVTGLLLTGLVWWLLLIGNLATAAGRAGWRRLRAHGGALSDVVPFPEERAAVPRTSGRA